MSTDAPPVVLLFTANPELDALQAALESRGLRAIRVETVDAAQELLAVDRPRAVAVLHVPALLLLVRRGVPRAAPGPAGADADAAERGAGRTARSARWLGAGRLRAHARAGRRAGAAHPGAGPARRANA